MLIWERKDPDETVLRMVDWRDRMGEDCVTGATFSVASGTVTIDSSDYDGRYSVVKLSGGAIGEKAQILCEVDTYAGQLLQETASMLVKAR